MIWLRYTKDGMTYDRRFDDLGIRPRPQTDRLSDRMLNGVDYSFLLWERFQYSVEIGADELSDPAAEQFVLGLWGAQQCFIAESASPTVPDDGDFIECTLPGGVCPLEDIEGWEGLPTIVLTLNEKYPR